MIDYVVIGAGYGGLSAAALLAQHGFRVTLLEAHTAIGGCASFFRRKDFLFDVGATTLSGVRENQPVGMLFKKLGLRPELKKIDPGMIIHLPDAMVIRHAEAGAWIEEAVSKFGSNRQKDFWNHIHEVDRKAWSLISNNELLPPSSLTDFLRLMTLRNIRSFPLIAGLFRPLRAIVEKHRLQDDPRFVRFLDEQLLISTQNTSENAPWITSAMGLSYPSETYYPMGGMTRPLEEVLNSFKHFGGEARFKQQVDSINQTGDGYVTSTNQGERIHSKGVVSNLSVWDMAGVTTGKLQRYFTNHARNFTSAWGAFTVYFAVKDFGAVSSLYHQVHTDSPIPHCGSRSFFVSFSLQEDRDRAPAGWRTVTISTHTPVEPWQSPGKSIYDKRKEEVQAFMFDRLHRVIPGMKTAEKMFVLSGTPSSFEFFTRRFKGYVGGIPHSIRRNLLSMPPAVTPFKHLYCVGDTVFPGQGTPAVVLSAFNVVRNILRRN